MAVKVFQNFNPRSPYGERLQLYVPFTLFGVISIHAPLTGSDLLAIALVPLVGKFQSTLPLRGATSSSEVIFVLIDISIHAPLTGSDRDISSPGGWRMEFQSTLPLRGATSTGKSSPGGSVISIHAPLTGSDPPDKEVTDSQDISIHAPLTGSDREWCSEIDHETNFNPRSPYGERLSKPRPKPRLHYFNPRSPYGERPMQ